MKDNGLSLKNILKMVFFLVGFCGIAFLLSIMLRPKTSDAEGGISNPNARGFYGEPENSLDVVVIGNSNAYSAVSPMVLWKKSGIASYVAAEGAQNIGESINILKELLTCQKPKLIILEADCMWAGKTKVDRIEGNIKSMMYGHIPMLKYHDRWKHTKPSEWFIKPSFQFRSETRGQYLSKEIVPFEGESPMVPTDAVEPIPKSTKFFLDIFLDICKENDIEVMFIEVPTANSWNYKKHNAMVQFSEETGMKFIDFNTIEGEYAVDWSTDTRDGGRHLNCFGAEKVTKYLAEYFDENFSFENRKSDEAYKDWNQCYKKYKKYIKGKKAHGVNKDGKKKNKNTDKDNTEKDKTSKDKAGKDKSGKSNTTEKDKTDAGKTN